jgi:hypothetical protein
MTQKVFDRLEQLEFEFVGTVYGDSNRLKKILEKLDAIEPEAEVIGAKDRVLHTYYIWPRGLFFTSPPRGKL